MATQATAAEWLTVREAAELANVSRTHVWRLVTRGVIPAIRVGPHEGSPIRIRRDVFLSWLEADPEEEN
jgi:excisionase family DNA binding protein